MQIRATLSAVVAVATLMGAPALAAPQGYLIDDAHSFARFAYSHFGLSTQQSRFNGTTATSNAGDDVTIGIALEAIAE